MEGRGIFFRHFHIFFTFQLSHLTVEGHWPRAVILSDGKNWINNDLDLDLESGVHIVDNINIKLDEILEG